MHILDISIIQYWLSDVHQYFTDFVVISIMTSIVLHYKVISIMISVTL